MSDELPRCTGYFHLPEVWIGAEPGMDDPAEVRQQEVCHRELPQGMTVLVYRDGLVLFDFGAQPYGEGFAEVLDQLRARLLFVNAHLACLYSALLSVQGQVAVKSPVGALNVVHRFGDDDPYLSCRDPLVWAAAGPDRRFQAWGARSHSFPKAEPASWRAATISEEALAVSFEWLAALMVADEWALIRADLYLRACAAFELHDLELCVSTAWSLCEHLLSAKWQTYAQKKGRRPGAASLNRHRRELLKGRDFTASIITEVLELADEIDGVTYELLGRVRKSRNKWLHGLQAATIETAREALDLCGRLLSDQYAVSFKLMPSEGLSF